MDSILATLKADLGYYRHPPPPKTSRKERPSPTYDGDGGAEISPPQSREWEKNDELIAYISSLYKSLKDYRKGTIVLSSTFASPLTFRTPRKHWKRTPRSPKSPRTKSSSPITSPHKTRTSTPMNFPLVTRVPPGFSLSEPPSTQGKISSGGEGDSLSISRSEDPAPSSSSENEGDIDHLEAASHQPQALSDSSEGELVSSHESSSSLPEDASLSASSEFSASHASSYSLVESGEGNQVKSNSAPATPRSREFAADEELHLHDRTMHSSGSKVSGVERVVSAPAGDGSASSSLTASPSRHQKLKSASGVYLSPRDPKPALSKRSPVHLRRIHSSQSHERESLDKRFSKPATEISLEYVQLFDEGTILSPKASSTAIEVVAYSTYVRHTAEELSFSSSPSPSPSPPPSSSANLPPLTLTSSTPTPSSSTPAGTGVDPTQKQFSVSAPITVAKKTLISPDEEKMLSRRRMVVLEILETEKNYVQDLHVIISVFKNPLERKKMFDDKVLASIFPEVLYNIQGVAIAMLTKLQERVDSVSSVGGKSFMPLGDIFRVLADLVKCYVDYVNNYEHAYAELQREKSENIIFAKFLRSVEKDSRCNNKTLEDFLITIVQRIPRYAMLLDNLLKFTPVQFPDHKKLDKALSNMRLVADHVNEEKEKFMGRQGALLWCERLGLRKPPPHRLYRNKFFMYRLPVPPKIRAPPPSFALVFFTDRILLVKFKSLKDPTEEVDEEDLSISTHRRLSSKTVFFLQDLIGLKIANKIYYLATERERKSIVALQSTTTFNLSQDLISSNKSQSERQFSQPQSSPSLAYSLSSPSKIARRLSGKKSRSLAAHPLKSREREKDRGGEMDEKEREKEKVSEKEKGISDEVDSEGTGSVGSFDSDRSSSKGRSRGKSVSKDHRIKSSRSGRTMITSRDISLAVLPDAATEGGKTLLTVHLGEEQKKSAVVSNSSTLEEVLRKVCLQRNLDYDSRVVSDMDEAPLDVSLTMSALERNEICFLKAESTSPRPLPRTDM